MFASTEWRDLWAAVLFYAHLIGLLGIIGFHLPYIHAFFSNTKNVDHSVALVEIVLGPIVGSFLLAVLLIIGFFALVHRAPESIIKATLITSIATSVLMAVLMMASPGGLFVGIFLFFFSIIDAFIFFSWRKKIPFSSILLKTTVEVFKEYPTVWNMPVFSVAASGVFMFAYFVAGAGILLRHAASGQEAPDPAVVCCALYLVFSLYWSMEVIKNVVHTTVAGVMATFYFLHGSGAAIVSPVGTSFKRALTLSFGSICFGSLIIALIQFLRFLLNSVNDKSKNNLAAALADCFLAIIESLVQYFNFYAYVHIAIYGKPFIPSAKDTWEMIKKHGVDVIINDCIVGTCLTTAASFISRLVLVIVFGVAVLLVKFTDIAADLHVAIAYGCAVAGFLVAFLVCLVTFQVVSSAVSSTLVCYAENPDALQRTKPELYHQITSKYNIAYRSSV